MRRILFPILFLFLWPSVSPAAEEQLIFGPFGKVTLYQPKSPPSNIVIFVSGDGGWNLGVIDMARALSENGALVAGIDITHYLNTLSRTRASCDYPAGDFENLSKFIQLKSRFKTYRPPLLVGYSSGATLVYAAMAQAPPDTFSGAVSLGFCPTLPLAKPLCRGSGLEWTKEADAKEFSFLPAKHLKDPWIAFQGAVDQVCDADATQAFVSQVRGGELVPLPKVGHGFSVQKNWMPQFKEVYARLTGKSPGSDRVVSPDLSDLPLVELPSAGPHPTLAVIVSGDGGWAGVDRELGQYLTHIGISVVGLDALKYFWTARTPEETSKDLNRILSHYLRAWNKQDAVVIGYSFGANVLPFMVSRQPKPVLDRISGLALLAPTAEAAFEFHLSDWLGGSPGGKGYPVMKELNTIVGPRLLCMAGEDEPDSLCRNVDLKKVRVRILSGGHHFGRDYQLVGQILAAELGLQ